MNNTQTKPPQPPTWVRPINVTAIRDEIAAGQRTCEAIRLWSTV